MNELAALRKRIAELETAEAERKQLEEEFRSLVEHSSDIIQVVDEKGIIRYVSPSVERVLGYKPEELLGRASTDVVHPDDLEKVAESFGRVRQPGETTTIECRCRHKDGSWRVIEGTGTNHLDLPAVNGFISNMHDVTDRKKTEERLERSFVDLAETFSRAETYRDPYSSTHQRRVAQLVRAVGERMGLDRDGLLGLEIGGLLHDIGKVAVPEAILHKPGELSQEEWSLVRLHARQGYEILQASNLPWPVAEMALHHHERLDGSGYPDGIGGDELSLETRILAVCNVAEAMSAHRSYRPARSRMEIVEELRDGKGTRYDARVVDILLEMTNAGALEPEGSQT